MNFCLDDGTALVSEPSESRIESLPTMRFDQLPDESAYVKTAVMNLAGASVLTTAARRRVRKTRAIASIAVLPFMNASPDPDLEYIGDGITESIINLLSRLPGLHVVARNTMFRYKGREVNPQTLSQQLGVQALLTGRVRQAGDRLIIGTELIDAASDSQLWGEHFHRRLVDIFEVQEEMAKEISERLSLKLSSTQKKRLTKRHTESQEAYELYLKGRYHWNKVTEEGFHKSIEFFAQACERDTGFALAYSGLADAYGALGYFNYLPASEAFPSSKKHATNALEIDDALAEAHLSLAGVKFLYDWDWQGAAEEFKRAIDLNPGYATAHHIYGHYLAALGKFEEAIAQMMHARKLDPLSIVIGCSLGFTFYRARNYEEAIKHFRSVLDLAPTFHLAHEGMGATYLEMGDHDEAFAEYMKAISHWPEVDQIIPALREAYAGSGMSGYWRKWIEHCTTQMMPSFVTPCHVAGAYSLIGEKDRAFEWLEKAFEERMGFLVYLKVEPIFDSLRPDPRFADLLGRVGLEPN